MRVFQSMIWTLFVLTCPCHLWGQEFRYPIIPDTIRDSRERTAYMAEHFWDAAELSDTTLFNHPKLLMDYLYLLRQSDDAVVDRCTQHFIASAANHEDAFGWILFWMDNALYDAASPQYDEDLYARLLDIVLQSEADSVMKLIPAQRMEMMSKNKVGHPANDFVFTDKQGKLQRLYGIDSPIIMLIFNNPDCSLCHQTETLVCNDQFIQSFVSKARLTIVSITPDGRHEEWMRHVYPPNWLTGYDATKTIYTQRLYDIQRLPCIYLLDQDKRVLLKEADYGRASKFLMDLHLQGIE